MARACHRIKLGSLNIRYLLKQEHLFILLLKFIKLLDIRKYFYHHVIFKCSENVDMWGAGTILYTLLTGEPPFYDTS